MRLPRAEGKDFSFAIALARWRRPGLNGRPIPFPCPDRREALISDERREYASEYWLVSDLTHIALSLEAIIADLYQAPDRIRPEATSPIPAPGPTSHHVLRGGQ